MHTCRVLMLLGAGTLLASCGGGGGGNGPVAPVPFTSFSAVTNGQPVQASGMSQTVNAQLTGSSVPTVTSTSVNSVDTGSSSAQMTYAGVGGNPVPSAFSYNAPGSSAGWSGTGVICGSPGCAGQGTNSVGAIINALDPTLGWNYQSFGYWLVIGSATSGLAGAMSFGTPTPVTGLPATGSATYTGQSSGIYVDAGGTIFIYRANMSSTVNFATPLAPFPFFTSGTTAGSVAGGGTVGMSTLDLQGSFSIIPGTGQFSGSVNAPGTPGLSGTATGRFYGPTAQEMGGIYALTGTGPQTMLGGFGGKRP